MSAPEVERRTVRTVRVELPGGRVVCAGLRPGDPGEVVLRVSAPEAPPGGRREDSIRVPADALPELTEALEALAGGMTTNPTDGRAEVSGG